MEIKTRTHPRLKDYDYSSAGAYFVTVCTRERRHILSTVENTAADPVGRPLAAAIVRSSKWGEIVQQELIALENRFSCLRVDKFVIMPNHVHAIFILDNDVAAASGRPTVPEIIRAWKSLSTRHCKLAGFNGTLWQTSFYDHIIRDENDYLTRWNYIDENPARWVDDEYYAP